MTQDNLANLMTLPDFDNVSNLSQPFATNMPTVNEGITYNPKPIYTPYIPKGTPDAVNINDHIVGNEQDGPNPGIKKIDNGTMDFVKSVNSYIGQADTWAKDEFKYGRAYSYGAGWRNANYERYYSSPQFKNLGFSPYRDNESVYNEKSSWWDDFNRMRGQWLGLAWNGVKSAGVGELFGSADDSADSFEKAMAIGTSTKKGVGAFMTNLTLNSAYTLGIMGEIVVENLALGALDVATFGGTSGLHGAAIAKQAFSAGKLFEGIKGTFGLLKELKDVEKAKSFFTATRAGEAATDFAKWINPLQHTTEFATNLAKNTSSFNKLGSLAKTARGFSSFYKDLREIELAHSEAKMEGATAAHQYHQNLIDKYYNEFGKMPDGQDAQDIYDKAQSIRAGVTLANDFVIYGSNKLTIGKLLDGFPTASFAVKALGETSLRDLEKTAAKEVLTKGAYELVEPTALKKAGRFLISSEYLPWSRAYIAGNLSEALQENAQDIIQDYQRARHDKIDSDPSQIGFWSAMTDLNAAVGKQFNSQGLETFMSGFLMGSIAGGTQGLIMGGVQRIQEYNNKEEFDKAKISKQENENAIVNAVNSLAKDSINYGAHNAKRVATSKILADEQDKAAANGDQYNFNNIKDEHAFEHFHTLESNGKMHLFTDHIDDMLKLSDEDLADAYNKPSSESKIIRKRLNNIKTKAEQFSSDFRVINKEYENPHNPSMFDPQKDPILYEETKLDYLAHNEAVKQLLFSVTASKRIAERMSNVFSDLVDSSNWMHATQNGKVLTNAAGSDLSLLLDNFQRSNEISALQNEIDALKEGTPEQKAQAKIKQEKLDLIEEFNNTLINFNKEISQTTQKLTEEQKQAQITKSKIRTGAVIKEAGKDVEYKVKKIVGNIAIVEDKDGKTINIDRDKAVLVKESKAKVEYEEGDTLTEALSMLQDSFNKYAQYLAKTKGGIIKQKELENTFNELKDFYLLERDGQRFVQAINALNNPQYMKMYMDLEKQAEKIREDQKAQKMVEAYNKFLQLIDENKFLNNLFDIGVWIMPEDAETYKTKPRDVKFYDVVNKEIVKTTSDKYKEILKVVEKYEKATGIFKEKVEEPVKPEEKPSKPTEQKPKEAPPVKTGEPITPTTSIDVIAKLSVKDKLIEAYKKAGKEPDSKLQMVGGTDEEIMATSTFKEFLLTKTAIDILDKYNVATGRVKAKVTPKEVVVPVKPAQAPTTATVSDIEAKIKAYDKTIEPEFEEGDYRKVLLLAQTQVKNGKIDQTPENLQLLANYPGLFEELIKATEARNKTIAEFDKEAVLVGKPKELPIYGIESSVNPATGKLNIKWVVVETRPITNIETIKIGNYAADMLFGYKDELAALEETQAPTAPVSDTVTVYHHTSVKPKDFDFGSFKRGKQQVSQFGDGLNASSTTTSFLVQRYGQPIQGEVRDSDFIVIDANKTEKELYEELKGKGYKFNSPDRGSYTQNDPAKEYDGTEKANEQPAIISLFNDFQNSNPEVKGVKVVNHIIGGTSVDPFYVIYDSKSFYGPGSLSKNISVSDKKAEKADIEEKLKIAELIEKARSGDKDAQQKLKTYGLSYEKKPVYRYVSQREVDALNNGERIQGKFKDGRVDVTTNPNPSTGADAEYRITFNDTFDFNKGDKARLKNEELGDGWISEGGYTKDDILIIEKRNDDGTYTTVYEGTNKTVEEELKAKLAALESKPAVQAEIEFPETTVTEPVTEVAGIEVPEFMAEDFAKVKTLEDLDKVLAIKLADPKLNLTSEYIDELKTRLREELMKKLSFDIIEQGDIILDANNNAFYVTKKTKNQIKLRSFDLQKMAPGAETKTVTKATFDKKIKLIYSKNMEIVGTKEEVTPQESKESKQLIETISKIDSPEVITNDFKNSTTLDDTTVDNELLSLINSCEQ